MYYLCRYISIFPKLIHSSISNHTTLGGELFLFFLPGPECPLLLNHPGRPCFSKVSFSCQYTKFLCLLSEQQVVM